MIFNPETYSIEDKNQEVFIDSTEIWNYLNNSIVTKEKVLGIISKSLNKQRLSLEDVAVLLNANNSEYIEAIKNGAKILKQNIYGNRIVFFAPLYIGNSCQNDCKYCGFRKSNKAAIRKTLTKEEIISNVQSLEADGHKRLIIVFGEHTTYSPEFIKESVKTIYETKQGNGEIRRVNINAAPFSIEEFKTIKDAGIGTYQIFQETYHPETYSDYHPSGKKSDFNYRLTALDRAQEAGIDDVGIGVLFGLYDWRYEVMGLVRHANHLESCYNVGPHTISFPRIQKASGSNISGKYLVNDEEFTRLIAILRLAVPYTGLILTARESEKIRDEVMQFGCSQIDAGTNIEIGAYANKQTANQNLEAEQFFINDNRTLAEMIEEIVNKDYMPSFCTACYRAGRTGEHFMEYCVPGFIHKFCTPNSILTFAEYLEDYAKDSTKTKGYEIIEKSLLELEDANYNISKTKEKLALIKDGKRDLYF